MAGTMDTTVAAPRRRVAIIGAGPGGLAAALAFHRSGHEVRLFERQEAVQPLGGAVLLSLPVLSVLRDMGVDIRELGAYGVTEFRNCCCWSAPTASAPRWGSRPSESSACSIAASRSGTNKNAKMARYMGYLFHRTPWPLSALRDVVFDHTRFLEAMLVENYLKDAEMQMETLPISAH